MDHDKKVFSKKKFPSLDLEIDWDSPPIHDKEILDDLMSQSFIVYKNISVVQESLELKG